MNTDTIKPVKVKADIFWAQSMHTPSSMSGKYELTLANLSEGAVKALETIGLTVRTREDKPDQGFFLVCKSAKFPIQAYDEKGQEIPASVMIANGTKATAVLSSFSWKSPTGKRGTSASLKKLVVTELIEYNKDGTAADAEPDFDDDIL
jgi:hypothetical protein